MKLICETRRCGWHGQEEQALEAPNPFEPDDVLIGCPECKSVDSLAVACDEPDCWKPVSCGTPTPKGYRSTCYEHMPKEGTK